MRTDGLTNWLTKAFHEVLTDLKCRELLGAWDIGTTATKRKYGFYLWPNQSSISASVSSTWPNCRGRVNGWSDNIGPTNNTRLDLMWPRKHWPEGRHGEPCIILCWPWAYWQSPELIEDDSHPSLVKNLNQSKSTIYSFYKTLQGHISNDKYQQGGNDILKNTVVTKTKTEQYFRKQYILYII